MDEKIKKNLVRILDKYELTILDEPERFKNLLSDFIPGKKKEIRILQSSVEDKIPQELFEAIKNNTHDLIKRSLVNKFKDYTGYSQIISNKTIELWYETLKDFMLIDKDFEKGILYYYGYIDKSISKNYETAFSYFKRSWNKNNLLAGGYIGLMYIKGQGSAKDNYKGIELLSSITNGLKNKADNGDKIAQFLIAKIYKNGYGAEKNVKKAFKYYKESADQGFAPAQCNLGNMYKYARGVEQDYTEALKWYKLSANQGSLIAQFNLGYMYDVGKGVNQDYTEAVKWYKLSAEQGNADAQIKLGDMYYNGEGVKQDYAEALKWYKLSAELGIAVAQCHLGYMYDVGKGVNHDYTEAVKWD